MERHEAELAEMTETVEKLTSANAALTSKASAREELTAQLAKMHDEVDCLKHAASKLPLAEKQLVVAKEKIEALLPLKEQLAGQEKAHAEALDKLLVLEKENEAIPGLKKQVDTYKKKSAAAEIKVDELTADLAKLSKLSAAVQKQNAALSLDNNLQLQEAQELQRLLVDSYGGADDNDMLAAIGAGVSELNPAMVEELARLRSDNELLKGKVSATSVESIKKLEDAVDDLERKCEGYKEKLEAEKERRSKDNSKSAALLKQTRADLEATKAELLLAKGALEKAELKAVATAEETKTEKMETQERFTFVANMQRNKHEANLALTTVGLGAILNETREKLVASADALQGLEEKFDKYKSQHSVDNEALQAKQKEYKHKINVANATVSQLEDEVAQLTQSRRATMIQQSSMQEEMDRLRKQGASLFGAESDMEAQFEALQHEYAQLLEENKQLAKGEGGGGGG
jgi:chromosome segregation ATPase